MTFEEYMEELMTLDELKQQLEECEKRLEAAHSEYIIQTHIKKAIQGEMRFREKAEKEKSIEQ